MEKVVRSLEALALNVQSRSQLFRPEFFRLSEKVTPVFEALIKTPGILVVDRIYDQVKELIKIRHPRERLTADELSERTTDFFKNNDPLLYGVWVYYPWSNRLVHLLDKEEFIEVRTSRNQYKITPAERDQLSTKKIGVIGLSVGQSVSVTLAMERVCGELRLADFDTLELTNLNRIRTGVHNLGLAKVYSVAREVAEIDPYINVTCFPEGLTEKNMDDFFLNGGRLDLLVEESDGFDIKILSRYKARELKVPVIMEASDRCMVDVERFDREPDRPILHGIVKNLDVSTLKTLSSDAEKIRCMLDVLGFEKTTPRLRASMLEMQQTIGTWPQLASAVTMGGGIAADVSRRVLLNHFTDSGRYYVDIEELIGNKEKKETAKAPSLSRISFEELRKTLSDHKNGSSSFLPDEKQLGEIIQAALFAPSFANAQPWKWQVDNTTLLLFDDLGDSEFLSDPCQNNKIISLGAAIETACLKAASLGFVATPCLYPSPENKRLVASFRFEKGGNDAEGLSAMIKKRRTNRAFAEVKKIGASQLAGLQKAFTDSGASLHLIESEQTIARLAQVAGICEKLRLTDPGLNTEFFNKIVSNLSNRDDLMKAMNWPPAMELIMQVVSDPAVAALLGQWELGSVFSDFTEKLVRSTPVIGYVSVPSTEKHQVLKAGMDIQRAWLTATKSGLTFHPFSLPLSFVANSSQLPADKKSYLEGVKEQLSLIFSGVEAKNVIFLFRILEAGKQVHPPVRKILDESFRKAN